MPKLIRQKMIIVNVSSEAILRNTFESVALKNVRDLPLKLHLTWFN